MSKRTKRKGPAGPPASRQEHIELERRRALQRALRLQKSIRSRVGQLRRSMVASDAALMELRNELEEKFAAVAIPGSPGRRDAVSAGATSDAR